MFKKYIYIPLAVVVTTAVPTAMTVSCTPFGDLGKSVKADDEKHWEFRNLAYYDNEKERTVVATTSETMAEVDKDLQPILTKYIGVTGFVLKSIAFDKIDPHMGDRVTEDYGFYITSSTDIIINGHNIEKGSKLHLKFKNLITPEEADKYFKSWGFENNNPWNGNSLSGSYIPQDIELEAMNEPEAKISWNVSNFINETDVNKDKDNETDVNKDKDKTAYDLQAAYDYKHDIDLFVWHHYIKIEVH